MLTADDGVTNGHTCNRVWICFVKVDYHANENSLKNSERNIAYVG